VPDGHQKAAQAISHATSKTTDPTAVAALAAEQSVPAHRMQPKEAAAVYARAAAPLARAVAKATNPYLVPALA
jgi:hypothetical protein